MLAPMFLLAVVAAVPRVKAAVKLGFTQTIDTPLFPFCLFDSTNPFKITLLSHFVNRLLLALIHAGPQLVQNQI